MTVPKIVDLLHLHGDTLFVYDHEGQHYVNAKSIADFAGLTWRSAKKALLSPRNTKLFGIVDLNEPEMTPEGHLKVTPLNLLMRVDRVYLYLAGIDTERMAANGKEDEADYLLTLQIEWAEALHDYETKGIAIKRSHLSHKTSAIRELNQLIRSRQSLKPGSEHSALTHLIHQLMTELGCPVSPATDLFS